MKYTNEQESKVKQYIKNLTSLRDYMREVANKGEIIDATGEFIKIETRINFGAGMQNCNPALIQEAKDLITEIHELTDQKKDKELGRERRATSFRYMIGDFSRGAFEELAITTQEQFDDFISKIPEQYKNAKKQALENWKIYMEYQKLPIEEIESKLNEEKKELSYLKAYYKIIEKGIKCDYVKLKREVSTDELEGLIEELDRGSVCDYNNRAKRKNNPFHKLLIDKADEEAWEKQEKYRNERLYKMIHAQEGRMKMINSILQNKKKSQRIEENAKSEEYDINSLESKNEADNFDRTEEPNNLEQSIENLHETDIVNLEQLSDEELDKIIIEAQMENKKKEELLIKKQDELEERKKEEARREKIKKLKTLISRNSELDAEIAAISNQIKEYEIKD